MKTNIFFSLTLLCLIFFLGVSAQNSNEQQAIKKVLDQETRSYFEMKYDAWASTWMHDSTVFRMSMSPTQFSKIVGWNNMNQGMKESMQGTAFTEEQMAPYLNKFGYKFYINGNVAHVFFKEGKDEKSANDEERLMVKQNGEWKIAGITIVNTPIYNFINDRQKLNSFIGKWKVKEGSYKDGPPDSVYKLSSFTYDVHPASNDGIEFASMQVWNSVQDNSIFTTTEYEQFVPDNDIMKFHYYDNVKSSAGFSGGGAGYAEFDSTGSFLMKMMYDDKPVLRVTNKYTLNKDGTVHFEGISFDTNGKQTGTWSFDLMRI